MQAIRDQIIDRHTFNRIRDYGYEDRFSFKTFEDFMEWQDKCLVEMPEDEYIMISRLCKYLNNGKVSLMDEDTCVDYRAETIYFDTNRHLVITSPR